ncbi:fructosamine kinase family protein [Flaviflexus huanghaiensis]|uniref:fructosamine kinase family protein n=1 Tax=Flaviflexus huanghaiensis TaxID=1111473 RepID=UPI0015FA890D|nr:fructosamine kinase family protein [Flaviflexus huanghaiensis]
MTFVKRGSRRQIAFEAAGLTDLLENGARVAELQWVKDTSLATVRIESGQATFEHAREFGRMLAGLHSHGGDRVFGQAPPGFDLDEHGAGTMGNEMLPLVSGGERPWGLFYAEDRILPYLASAMANGSIDSKGADTISALAERLKDGVFDTDDTPSILHGDLWSGNVMWSPTGAVLIDPASHTGHRESDLAQLTVFGVPHGEHIVAGYEEVSPLSEAWQERVGLHQLHILIVHASLFGGSYGNQTVRTAARYT